MQQMAQKYIKDGYTVSIILESRICVFRHNDYIGDSVHNQTIAKYIDFNIYENVFFLKLPKTQANNWYKLEAVRSEYYQKVLEDNEFNEVLIWNGNFQYQQLFLTLLKKQNQLKKNFIEVAWFDQNNSVYIDPNGVNGASLLAKTPPPELTEKEISHVKAFIEGYTKGHPLKVKGKREKLKILIPLQVDTDSNIIKHSPFKDMKEFICFLEDWIPKDNVEVTLRAHPKAVYDYEIKSNRTDFIVNRAGCIKNKIAESDLIIGINSTVLLQSLPFYKHVIAFGDGVYNASSPIVKMDFNDTFQLHDIDIYEYQKLIHFLVFGNQIQLKVPKINTQLKYVHQRLCLLFNRI
ncbi:hypothetical protein ACOYR1_03780 [Thalassotalea piscium]